MMENGFRENEFVCTDCGEIFIPEKVTDPHFEKSDGTECGGSALTAQFLVQFPNQPVVLYDVSTVMYLIQTHGMNVGHGGEGEEFQIYHWDGDHATRAELRLSHIVPSQFGDWITDVWELSVEGNRLFNVWVKIDARA